MSHRKLWLSLLLPAFLALACSSSVNVPSPKPSTHVPTDTPIGQQITGYYKLIGYDRPLWDQEYPDPAQMDTKTVMGAINNPQLVGCKGGEVEYLDYLEGAIDKTSQFFRDVAQLHSTRPCGPAAEFIEQPAKGEGVGKTERWIKLKAISEPDGVLAERVLRLVLVRNCQDLPLWLLTDASGPVTGCA